MLIILCLVFAVIFAIFWIYAYICIAKLDKNIISEKNLLNSFDERLVFYDNEGTNLGSTFSNGKTIAKLNELPNYVKNAFISIEDKTFYSHSGINIKRIMKSFFDNLTSGYAKSGASTISQQLVKNLHLSSEKTLKRKIQEAYLTKKLEQKFCKDEILETYLNVIYFGNNAYGIENAANKYFNCSAKELTLHEAATLAGIIKSPNQYSPITNPNSCIKRRNTVLREMKNDGYITQEEFTKATNQELNIKLQQSILDNTPYFVETIKEAEKILNMSEKDIAESNYRIYTYLDSKTQKNAINSLKESTQSLTSFQSFCSVVLDNKTSGVISFVSNVSFMPTRQPGSLMKPILCYAPAFEEGILSPLTPIDDSPIKYENWSPQNANNTYEGYVSTRYALYDSKNIPAIKTLTYVGIDKAKSYVSKQNISWGQSDNHLALALGAMEKGVTPLEMATCYKTFANNGEYEKCHFIRKIEDYAGRTIYSVEHKKTCVFSEETAYLINDILHDCSQKGTAKELKDLKISVCAKTGTVGNNGGNTDAWCTGYNKELTILSWAGNTTGKIENNLNNAQNGGTITAKMNKGLWQQNAHRKGFFTPPQGIIKQRIDSLDYENKHILNLANESTPIEYVIEDIFNIKYAPTTFSSNFLEPNIEEKRSDFRFFFRFLDFAHAPLEMTYSFCHVEPRLLARLSKHLIEISRSARNDITLWNCHGHGWFVNCSVIGVVRWSYCDCSIRYVFWVDFIRILNRQSISNIFRQHTINVIRLSQTINFQIFQKCIYFITAEIIWICIS